MTEPVPVISNPGVVVLLPFATYHKNFPQPWNVFHPAALIFNEDQSKSNFKESTDYTGFASVKFGSYTSHTVVATIPPKSTVAGMAVDQLLSTFVNPENILAEVERVECDDSTIAGQMDKVFSLYEHARSLLVIWPYQVFSSQIDKVLMHYDKTSFIFTHPNANHRKGNIPECMVVAPTDIVEENSIECKDVQAYDDLEPMIRGGYSRVLTMVEVFREDFAAYRNDPQFPKLAPLLKKTLAGKQGLMMNPNGHQFI